MIPEARVSGRLVPALIFGRDDELDVVDVAVRGSFPTDFRLDAVDRPPESALKPLSFLDEPRAALGYFTAVPEGHATSIRVASAKSSRSSEDAQSVFAGYSKNYLVAYLSAAVPADSYTAFVLGASDDLAPGYHLIGARPFNTTEWADAALCEDGAKVQATAEINERHGLELSPSDVFSGCVAPRACESGAACGVRPTPQSPLCELSTHERGAIREEFEQSVARAHVDLRCALDGFRLTHVADSSAARITVVLSHDTTAWGRWGE